MAPSSVSSSCKVYISCEPKFVKLAVRLAADLERDGFKVWFKRETVDPTHPDYDASKRTDGVEQGMQWASTKDAPTDGVGKCIAILTPGAVTRSTGFCADELLKAFTKGLFFVPLMVRHCEAPLHMCSIQWLEFKATVTDAGDITAHFPAAYPKLVKALRSGQLDTEGKQARLITTLTPLDFEADLATHVDVFFGRSWVLDAVDAWLDDPSGAHHPRAAVACGPATSCWCVTVPSRGPCCALPPFPPGQQLLWYTGNMGVGKTALAAYLSAHRPAVLAYHLATTTDDTKCDARRAVLSLAYQLCTQLPSVWDSFFCHKLLEDAIQVNTAESLFDLLIVRPLTDVADPPKPAALLIDGLDTMSDAGRNEFARILALALRPEGMTLPSWIRVIVFSRCVPGAWRVSFVVWCSSRRRRQRRPCGEHGACHDGGVPHQLVAAERPAQRRLDAIPSQVRQRPHAFAAPCRRLSLLVQLHRLRLFVFLFVWGSALRPFSSEPGTTAESDPVPADVAAAAATVVSNADGLFMCVLCRAVLCQVWEGVGVFG